MSGHENIHKRTSTGFKQFPVFLCFPGSIKGNDTWKVKNHVKQPSWT